MSESLVRDQFGYVEDVENDADYRNIDYRDIFHHFGILYMI